MSKNEQEIVQELIMSDEEFRGLHRQHLQMEQELEVYEKKHPLSPADEVEIKRLKKIKLHGKDEMYRIISEYKMAKGA